MLHDSTARPYPAVLTKPVRTMTASPVQCSTSSTYLGCCTVPTSSLLLRASAARPLHDLPVPAHPYFTAQAGPRRPYLPDQPLPVPVATSASWTAVTRSSFSPINPATPHADCHVDPDSSGPNPACPCAGCLSMPTDPVHRMPCEPFHDCPPTPGVGLPIPDMTSAASPSELLRART
jgi:hypothetical protein